MYHWKHNVTLGTYTISRRTYKWSPEIIVPKQNLAPPKLPEYLPKSILFTGKSVSRSGFVPLQYGLASAQMPQSIVYRRHFIYSLLTQLCHRYLCCVTVLWSGQSWWVVSMINEQSVIVINLFNGRSRKGRKLAWFFGQSRITIRWTV